MIYFSAAVFALILVVVVWEAVRLLTMSRADYFAYRRRQRSRGRFTRGVVDAPIGWLAAGVLALSTTLAAIVGMSITTSVFIRAAVGVLFITWLVVTSLALLATYRRWPSAFVHPALRTGDGDEQDALEAIPRKEP